MSNQNSYIPNLITKFVISIHFINFFISSFFQNPNNNQFTMCIDYFTLINNVFHICSSEKYLCVTLRHKQSRLPPKSLIPFRFCVIVFPTKRFLFFHLPWYLWLNEANSLYPNKGNPRSFWTVLISGIPRNTIIKDYQPNNNTEHY